MTGTSPLLHPEDVRRSLAVLLAPGQVVEVRALEASYQQAPRYTETLGGYFDNPSDLIATISKLRTAMGIYLTLQPCDPDLLHRAANRIIRQKKDYSTPDKYITGYRWLLLDSDPDRVSSISSTDEEHAHALAHSRAIREELQQRGWPDPILADSGNGSHLLYRLDLPVEDADLVKRTLEGLAERFEAPGLHLDTTVCNPSRICKLYGTLVCKGDNTLKRPHRLSRLLEVPEEIRIVSREQLVAVAVPVQGVPPRPAPTGKIEPTARTTIPEFDLAAWIVEHGIETYGAEPYQGGTRWVLKACPWDASHTDKSAVLIQLASGAISASCRHHGCHGKKWEDLRVLYEPAAYTHRAQASTPESSEADPQAKEASQALKLVSLAREECELFSTPKGEFYTRVLVNGHVEVWPITSSSFKRWLIHRCLTLFRSIPQVTALTSAISALESQAEHGGAPPREVFLRLAAHHGKLYLDLANEARQAVEITAHGWRVLAVPPVCFRRPKGMLPLPIPVQGGSLDELKHFINVEPDDWILLLAWLVGTFHPTGPYAILALHGERGAAKSTMTRVLRALIDPAKAPLRKEPRDDQTFAIMAYNNYVVALDNLSHLSARLSDTMCTLSTGSGDAYRTLYANDEETLFDVCRPQVFNGIEELATRGDLIDRCLILKLPEIPQEQRRDERSYWQAFEAARPRLLGALLGAVSVAIRNLPHTRFVALPRMADFALWVQAAEPALTEIPGAFLQAYTRNRDEGVMAELEDSPVALALLSLIEQKGDWTGTAGDLKKQLEAIVGEEVARQKIWPGNGRALSGMLKRLAPSLRARGVFVQTGKSNGRRSLMISTTRPGSSGAKLENRVANVDERDAKSANSGAKFVDRDAKIENRDANDSVCATEQTSTTGQSSASGTQVAQNSHGSNSMGEIPKKMTLQILRHLRPSDPDDPRSESGENIESWETHPCTTRYEKRRKVPHQGIAMQFIAGCWWCERCALQCTWMTFGEAHNYPSVDVPAHGFKVKQGRESWLSFAQDAGYTLVEYALAKVQEQREEVDL